MVSTGRGPGKCSCAVLLDGACEYCDLMEQSDEEALRWFQQAANQGYLDAQFNLVTLRVAARNKDTKKHSLS